MPRFETVLMDIDNTLFDFDKTEENALRDTFEKYGVTFTQKALDEYRNTNRLLWERFEKGEIEKEYILEHRFDKVCKDNCLHSDKAEMNDFYTDSLSKYFFPCDGAEELCKALHGKCKLYIVTNGLKKVQDGRIALSKMGKYFDGIFISEVMGVQKPSKEFFDIVFDAAQNKDRAKAIILGDSLTSDMTGGRNAGITTCRILPAGEKPQGNPLCDYEITHLSQFADIVLQDI